MFSRRGTWALASAPVLWVLLAAQGWADEAAQAAIAKLLDVGWSVTPQARAAAAQ